MILLKRYNEGQDGVGEWHFELNSVGILPKNEAGLKTAVGYLLRLIEALKTDDFFKFSHLRIDRWVILDAQSDTRRFEEKSCRYTLGELSDFISAPSPAKLALDAPEFWFPTGAAIEGSLRVLLPGQELQLHKAFWVRVAFSGAFSFSLVTDCDAYLSHDLLGHEQKRLMELNLPLLENALAAVTKSIGFEPYVEDTRYAIMLPHSIESKHEEDGEYHIVDEPERWIEQAWSIVE